MQLLFIKTILQNSGRASMNLIEQDKQHRLQALDASKSFIVQAPAGSGKTELLIQRFLTLLATVELPEEILAITFTKKAANEMRARVIKALKNAMYEAEPESAHAKQTWLLAKKVLQQDQHFQWQLINNPNQLRIQTIDSLCSQLTKQLPLLSHFGSQPDMADQPVMLYREAVQEVLMTIEEDCEWTPSLMKLLLHLDNDLNKLHELLINLLGKRDQWLPYIQLSSSDMDLREQLEKQLTQIITDALSELRRLFPEQFVPELLAIARFAAANVKAESNLRACEKLTALPGIRVEDKIAWSGLASLLLTKSFNWRKKVDEDMGFPALKNIKNPQELAIHKNYRERLMDLLEKLEVNHSLRAALEELSFLPYSRYSNEQWEILQSLLHILKISAAQLRVTFQQHGQIDFIENTQAALAALGNDEHPTDLALVLDYRIQHILIDEFQDTSYTQYQLLEKLTYGWEAQDGRTLFVVGDPMQSIYRFREAEVGLFIRMRRKGLPHIPLIPLTLAVNFRSTANIVTWNNTHFDRIFPGFNDMASGAVAYSPSVAHHEKESGEIKVHGFIDANDAAEAMHIIKIIQQTLAQYPQDKIAILVRSRPHLSAIIPALKSAAIPYHAIDIDPLASLQAIQDVYSLTCALIHPADRIAWLSILRAPWCGLTLTDLLVIAGNDPYAAIYSQLQSSIIREKLSEDGRKRVEKILPILQEKIAARERMPLRAWVESTWLLLGGPASLQHESEQEDVNAYFALLDEFADKYQSLNLDKLKEKMNQLFASTQHQDAKVFIMTIHTAKGLEFDTVILPQLQRKNPNDEKALLSWMEQPLLNEQVALLLAPVHATGTEKDLLYEYINRKQRVKSDYEMARLLYVATTRAKKRLHLLFNATRSEKQEIKVELGSFLGKIWPQWEKQQANIFVDSVSADTPVTSEPVTHSLRRFATAWNNPVRNILQVVSGKHQKSSGFMLPDYTARLIGTITHGILQMISQETSAWWLQQSQQQQADRISFLLIQAGVPEEKRGLAKQSILQAVGNTLADERGRWILYHHAQAKSEHAITAIIEDELHNLIIDRTFVDENNVCWIIDYKTSGFSDGNMDEFIKKEKQKYADKMALYQQAMRFQHHGEIRMGLYFPALPKWVEL